MSSVIFPMTYTRALETLRTPGCSLFDLESIELAWKHQSSDLPRLNEADAATRKQKLSEARGLLIQGLGSCDHAKAKDAANKYEIMMQTEAKAASDKREAIAQAEKVKNDEYQGWLLEHAQKMDVFGTDRVQSMSEASATNLLKSFKFTLLDAASIRGAWMSEMASRGPVKSTGDPYLEVRTLNKARDVLLVKFGEVGSGLLVPANARARSSLDLAPGVHWTHDDVIDSQVAQPSDDKQVAQLSDDKQVAQSSDDVTLAKQRIHRRTAKHNKALFDEMAAVFADHFESKPGAHVLCSVIRDYFVKTRGAPLSKLDEALFKRHSKKLFLAKWPDSKYDIMRRKRCFYGVDIKVI